MGLPVNKSGSFIPDLWSDELKKQLQERMRPKRSKAAQMLRDAALGHPEYPPPENLTATEIRMRNEQLWQQPYELAARRMADDIDKHVLDSMVYGRGNRKSGS